MRFVVQAGGRHKVCAVHGKSGGLFVHFFSESFDTSGDLNGGGVCAVVARSRQHAAREIVKARFVPLL